MRSSRRGRRSANLIFGNGVAVLTGDYMYAKALRIFATYGNMEMIRLVSETVMEMAEAQVLELSKVGEVITEEEYFNIIDGKTAVLFGACTAVGSMVAGYPDPRTLRRFGIHMGRAFQLVDDILDYTGDPSKTGKPVGNDLREGKVTYPLLSVLDEIGRDRVEEILRKPVLSEEDVEFIRSEVIRLGGIDRARERAEEEVRKATHLIGGFPESSYKRELIRILEFVVLREL
ncbi:MAG: polyprenyl synthetase family protein [Aquificota bacterium]|nr:polyprenyl synthetase family protein [Aquificota bacterium]